MKTNQLNNALNLFKAIALMEDSVEPKVADKEEPATALTKIKEAAKQKRALVKRTHPCELVIHRDSTAKPTVFTAGDVFDIQWDDQTDRLAVTLAITDADGDVSYPAGMTVIPLADITQIDVLNTKEAVMAAISNQALADNKSDYAKQIVDLLGLQPVVDDVKKKASPQQQQGTIQIMWFPVYGWRPAPFYANAEAVQADLDPAFPLTPFVYADSKNAKK